MTRDQLKPLAFFKMPNLPHMTYQLRYPAGGPRKGWIFRQITPAPHFVSDFYMTRRALSRAQLAPCNPVTL